MKFDGDDATLQEGLRAISVAVGKTFQPRTVVKHLPHDPANGEASEHLDEVDETEDEDAPEAPALSPSGKRRKAPSMSIVKDLDLRPKDNKHLRDFFAEKQPKKQIEQITTIVYYLSRILKLDGITPHHVYTCLKDVGKRVPNDLPQALRLVASRKGWVETSNADDIKITTSGENMVEHDLPPGGA